MRDFTVSFFLACDDDDEFEAALVAVAIADVVDESIFELPVMLPSDVVVVVAGGVAAVIDVDVVTAELVVIMLHELLPPAPFAVVVVVLAVIALLPIKSTTSFDGDGSICSSSMCSTRQYSL